MKALGMTIALIFIASSGSNTMAAQEEWPELPTSGYIAGRTATIKDVSAGEAAFVLAEGKKPIGIPIAIQIPQYARYIEDGAPVPVVVIQAEEARGQRVVAGRKIDGREVVGLLNDFELLGTKRPAHYP